MSGFVMATSPCVGCGRIFCYSPTKVPSVRVNGSREPICAGCVASANPQRIANGLEPIQIVPGAYDADDESEL